MNVNIEKLFGAGRKTALLRELFVAEGALTAGELSRRSGVSLAQAMRILRDYLREGVVVESSAFPKNVYLLGEGVKKFLRPLFAPEGLRPDETARAALRTMVDLGAPLMVSPDDQGPRLPFEEALPNAVRLARQDPAILSTLPVAVMSLSRLRPDPVFWNLVRRHAGKLGVEPHTGMLLEMVARVSEDEVLLTHAKRFHKDKRRRSLTAFRGWYRNRWERALAERRTPAVARAWGFLMNTDEADFRHHLEVA